MISMPSFKPEFVIGVTGPNLPEWWREVGEPSTTLMTGGRFAACADGTRAAELVIAREERFTAVLLCPSLETVADVCAEIGTRIEDAAHADYVKNVTRFLVRGRDDELICQILIEPSRDVVTAWVENRLGNFPIDYRRAIEAWCSSNEIAQHLRRRRVASELDIGDFEWVDVDAIEGTEAYKLRWTSG